RPAQAARGGRAPATACVIAGAGRARAVRFQRPVRVAAAGAGRPTMKRLGALLARVFLAFDWPLLFILVLFACLGLTVMHSAVGSTDWRFAEQSRNFLIAFGAMWLVALVPTRTLMMLARPFCVVGVAWLLGVEFVVVTSKGASRWLDLGITRIQPSEMMNIAVPLILAWYFQRHEGDVRIRDFLAAAVMLAAPFGLIVLQPDLGTALLRSEEHTSELQSRENLVCR